MTRHFRLTIAAALAAASLAVGAVPSAAQLPREHGTLEGVANATRGRTYDVENYRVDVRFDEAKRAVMGKVTITLAPFASGFRQFTLDAVDLRVKAVTVDGRPQQFKSTRDTLDVLLDRDYAAMAPLEATIEYECNPKRGIYFVQPSAADPKAPRQIWSQGEMEENRYWIPSYDFPNDKATSEMIVTVPSKYTVISNGVLVETKDAGGGLKTWHWRMDKPHSSYLNSLVVGELTEIKDEWDGIPILYYVYPGRESEGKLAFGRTPQMVQFFSERTGVRYPYPKYSQAVLHDFHFGGMENISATSQTDEALRTQRERLDGDADSLVAHELAHQWFGDLVTAKDWANMWLNESFATFMATAWSEHDLGRDAYLLEMRGHLRSYLAEDASRYRRPIVSNVYSDPIDVFDSHLYPGGAARINLLRHLLGEELFWRGINHYLTKFQYQNAETSDFKNAFEESTGRELDVFFDEWFLKAGVPEFAVSYTYDARKAQVLMHVEQKQPVNALTPIFSVPVDVVVTTARGATTHTVTLDKATQDLTFPAESVPLAVQFDPEGYVPKTLAFPRSRQELTYVLANGKTAVERSNAAEDLKTFVRDEDVATALSKALSTDANAEVRASAASSLGEIGASGSPDVLLAALGDKSPDVRAEVVAALASFPAARVEGALVDVVRKDQSYAVEAAALAALAKVKSPKAAALLRETLAAEGTRAALRASALRSLSSSNDAGALALALKYAAVGQPYELRIASLEVLGDRGAGNDDAYTALVRQATSEGFDLRSPAISAIGALGDKRALDVLRAIAADDRLDGRLRADARRGIKRISSPQ